MWKQTASSYVWTTQMYLTTKQCLTPPLLTYLIALCQIEASGENREKVLVFFKLYPTVITEDNLHHSVLVSSMLESPINTLYQALRQVFAPVLLKVSLSLCIQSFSINSTTNKSRRIRSTTQSITIHNTMRRYHSPSYYLEHISIWIIQNSSYILVRNKHLHSSITNERKNTSKVI